MESPDQGTPGPENEALQIPKGTREQRDFIVRNFGRQAIIEAASIVSRPTTVREIIGDEGMKKLQDEATRRKEAAKVTRRSSRRRLDPFRPR